MLSIPEIATQLVEDSLSKSSESNDSRTIFLLGSAAVGKTTLLYAFLDKNDTPRETLVLEYSFGRKSNQKQGNEKTICHVWEYGGKFDILRNILPSVPVSNNYYYCIMIDLSKIKTVWHVLETCLQIMTDTYSEPSSIPELVIIGGKYDLFKNYDADIKKKMCIAVRSVALIFNANVIYYSFKESSLLRRAKDLLHGIGFGNGVPNKEKNMNPNKPLIIPKGTDSWESIGVPVSTLEQVKTRHLSRFPADPELIAAVSAATGVGGHQAHPEPILDAKAALHYEQLRNLESLDISLDDYLVGLN